MDNPFAKLNPSTLANIMSRCDVADIASMRCTDRALFSLLRTRSVRNKIWELKQINNEYGYSLIIFRAQNSDEISEQRAIRAREVHVIKANNGVVMLENDVTHRRRLVVYEGRREAFNLGELWHQELKLPANDFSVLSFTAADESSGNFMVMKTNELEWRWTEHEQCRFINPSLNFTFIIEKYQFLKITSLLPQLPLPLRYATSFASQLHHTLGTELVDVNTRGPINPVPLLLPVPHVAFELTHVFEWGTGILYMIFLGDKNMGQEDLGCWMIEDMHPKRLDFAVFHLQVLPGRENLDNPCRGICHWMKRFLLPSIYCATTSFRYDKVELISSHNNDLFIMKREKTGEGILVDVWLMRESTWGGSVRLIAGREPRFAQFVVSFCSWRLNPQHFGMDCILVLAKLRVVEEGAWWIVKREGVSVVVVSQGILQDISDGTRFSLINTSNQSEVIKHRGPDGLLPLS